MKSMLDHGKNISNYYEKYLDISYKLEKMHLINTNTELNAYNIIQYTYINTQNNVETYNSTRINILYLYITQKAFKSSLNWNIMIMFLIK